MLDPAFAAASLPSTGALVLLVAEEAQPDGLWQAADRVTDGAVTRAFAAARFKGKTGSTCTILAPAGGLTRIVAVGLGKRDALTQVLLERAGGTAGAAVAGEPEAAIAADGLSPAEAAHVAAGAVLRAYRFDRYRTKEKAEDKPRLATLSVHAGDPAAATEAWAALRPVVEGVFLTRDLVTEPPNVLDPPELARRCEALTRLGLEVEVFGPDRMREMGMGLLLGVAQGSAKEPRMVVMRWPGKSGAGAKLDAPLAFIGKGVTFDTGGISIKPAGGMEDMKWDMAGAGAVIGAMAAVAGRRAPVDVVGVVGLVENMPDGNAQRPGDVVTSASGQTVEIINTDAEGRLVLADIIWHTHTTYAPTLMVDLATLTGAIIISLGHSFGGLYASDDDVASKLLAAGIKSGDRLWRMPLDEEYDKTLRSRIADMKHTGGRPGSSNSAAHFIQRFTDGRPWAHLDIAGMAWSDKDAPAIPAGATAYGVRLLDELARGHEG